MTNRFRRIAAPDIEPPQNQIINMRDLTLGSILDRSPRMIPAGASPHNSLIRFEDKAIRKDFGTRAVGAVAPSRVLGIGEFKYILNNQSFHRLLRFYLEGGHLAVDVWDGVNWVRVDISPAPAANVYLSLASTQNRFLIADGLRILTWYESPDVIPKENDFPTLNELVNIGDQTTAIITPGGAKDNSYNVRFRVHITVNSGSDYTVTVALLHEGKEIQTRDFVLATGVLDWESELFSIVRSIGDGEELTLKVKSIVAGTYGPKGIGWAIGVDKDLIAVKSGAESAYDGLYKYRYDVTHGGDDFTVRYYYRKIDTDLWIELGHMIHTSFDVGLFEISFNLGDLPVGAEFAADVTEGGWGAGDPTGSISAPTTGFGIEYLAVDIDLAVKAYNQEVDDDPYPGVSYEIETTPESVFEELSLDAPGARFILPFADRLLAYRDEGDHQVAAWSADGHIDIWLGFDPAENYMDAGETVLLDTRSDGIDNLMGAAVLSAGTVAVFRKRSIMRAQETGSVALAMGHYHWIENLGTESPFSIKSTPAGVVFLGHDLQVYLLTEQGPMPIGTHIHRELVKRLTSNLDLVDSVYDPIFGEYYLGIPEDNASQITGVWILKLNEYLQTQTEVWRYRPQAVERFALLSVIP